MNITESRVRIIARILMSFWIVGMLVCPPVPTFAKSKPSSKKAAKSENDFYRKLMKKKVATNADLIRAVARFKGYREQDRTESEVAYLRESGIRVDRDAARFPKRPVTKGVAANLFMNAMKSAADQRGLMGRIFTTSRRYAARDGMAQKLLTGDSLSHEFMSGGELMAMLGRAVNQTDEKQTMGTVDEETR